eukprot:scaffold55972_cov14-Tisochrysis_lutea.AAC.1
MAGSSTLCSWCWWSARWIITSELLFFFGRAGFAGHRQFRHPPLDLGSCSAFGKSGRHIVRRR